MNQYQQHPLSAAFPAMSEEEFQTLKASIEEIGVQNSITLFEGMVLDGWNRYRAAHEALMSCPSVELAEGVDPRDFVLAQNKARRHVTQAQLAMATTAVYAWAPAGKPKLHTECAVKTTSEMAGIAGVHRNTIVQAQAVQAKGSPAVVEAVKSGAIGLPKAAAIAQLPEAEQAAAIDKPLSEIKSKASPQAKVEAARKAAGRPLAEFSDAELIQAKEAVERTLAQDIPEYDGPSDEEIRAAQMQEAADQAAFNALLLADDKLAAAYAEVKRLNGINSVLESRLQGLMNEKNEAIKLCKSLQRQVDRLKKGAA